jgi:hypothetical protein
MDIGARPDHSDATLVDHLGIGTYRAEVPVTSDKSSDYQCLVGRGVLSDSEGDLHCGPHRRGARRAVQPVWWLAPRPAPVSPLKYS